MPATATVSISGMIVVQQMASKTIAASIGQKPSTAQSARNESSEPPPNISRMARRSFALSAAKLMAGVDRMRTKRGAARRSAMASSLMPRKCSQTGI